MKNLFLKVLESLKSKRVWTIIVMFLINGVAGISESISPGVLGVINPILLALGIIFGIKGIKKS